MFNKGGKLCNQLYYYYQLSLCHSLVRPKQYATIGVSSHSLLISDS